MSKVNFTWYTRSQHFVGFDLADPRERRPILEALSLDADTTEEDLVSVLANADYPEEKKIGEMLDEFTSDRYWVDTEPTDDVDWILED